MLSFKKGTKRSFFIDMNKKMPKSTRKFIRTEKARIRRQFFDYKKQQEMIDKMYLDISKKPEVSIKPAEVKEAKPEKTAEKKNTKKQEKKAKK